MFGHGKQRRTELRLTLFLSPSSATAWIWQLHILLYFFKRKDKNSPNEQLCNYKQQVFQSERNVTVKLSVAVIYNSSLKHIE